MSNVLVDAPFSSPPINLPICQGVYDLDTPWNARKPGTDNVYGSKAARSTHAVVDKKQGSRRNRGKGNECRIGFWTRLKFLFGELYQIEQLQLQRR
jgi:hypothetical protein